MKKYYLMLALFYLTPIFAWDATGHRLIALIAYQRLRPEVRTQIDQLTYLSDPQYPPLQRFLYASIWPDLIKGKKATRQNQWHFISLPYSADGTPTRPPPSENLIWAIQRSENILTNANTKPRKKTIYLRFLAHFVGDAHQPLHCIDRYSQQYPHGDKSGLLVSIIAPNANNLHAYWDEGAGLFRGSDSKYPLTTKAVKKLAEIISLKYPPSYFGNKSNDLNPQDWTEESFTLAKNFVYNIPDNSTPSTNYTTQAQQIAARQIALAGYRLANLLNSLLT